MLSFFRSFKRSFEFTMIINVFAHRTKTIRNFVVFISNFFIFNNLFNSRIIFSNFVFDENLFTFIFEYLRSKKLSDQ